MKAEIEKILTMVQAGQISNEQAAELIAALKTTEPSTPPAPADDVSGPPLDDGPREANPQRTTFGKRPRSGVSGFANRVEQFMETLGETVESFGESIGEQVSGAFTGGGEGNVSFSKGGKNRVVLSRFTEPDGENFIFEENSINVSSVAGLRFVHAQFVENGLHASNLNGLTMDHSEISDCKFNGSSLDALVLDRAKISDVAFNGTKASKWMLCDAEISDCKFHGCAMKQLELSAGSGLSDMSLNGCAFNDVQFSGSAINDCAFHGVVMNAVKFENVKMNDCAVKKCKFVNVTLKNLDLNDARFEDVELRDQVIDGEAQLRAALKVCQ